MNSRRDFLKSSALASVGFTLGSALARGQSRRMSSGGMT